MKLVRRDIFADDDEGGPPVWPFVVLVLGLLASLGFMWLTAP